MHLLNINCAVSDLNIILNRIIWFDPPDYFLWLAHESITHSIYMFCMRED